jgi:hypothetical protein
MKLVNRETGLTTSAVKAPNFAVDDFVAVKALSFNKVQQSSTRRPQTVQQQSLRNNKNPQISIRLGTWFGTRGSEVQILSPRPFHLGSATYNAQKRYRHPSCEPGARWLKSTCADQLNPYHFK